jgi:hypothetical protein
MVGMPKGPEWLTVRLTPELMEKMNSYLLAVANKMGRIPQGLKTKIVHEALEEWFKNHGSNLERFT